MGEIQIGCEKRIDMVVTAEDCANAYKSGGLEVFATPGMIALMEQTAYTLLQEQGIESVGTELNIKHTRACLPGTKVWAIATVTAVDGRKVDFTISAYDEKGSIGEGSHCRFVIDPEKFMAKLR